VRASVARPSPGDVAAGVNAWASRLAGALELRRWWIVGVCIAAQWAFVAHEALDRITHNGWLYQHGDDGPWYWTTAWAQTSLHVPVTAVGPGWPYILTPLSALIGPNMANGLPAVIALNLLVLAPASVVGMYLLAERIAGRLFGVWSAVLWTLLPALALLLLSPSHRRVVVNFFLPTAFGLNALSDYPSMVCAIFCAYLVLRSIDSNSLRDGVLCGLLLGFLILLKPANGALPVAGVLALGLTFRWRALIGTVAAAIPAAVALSIWKKTGTGGVPLFSGSGGGGGTGTPAVAQNVHKYLNVDFHHFAQSAHELSDVFWSVRLLEFFLIAGAVGLIARARWKGLFVVAWFLGFAVVKGGSSLANVYDTSFYRYLLPAWPAWTLIVAGAVFCWPGVVRRAARPASAAPVSPVRLPGRRLLVAAGLVLAVGPFTLIVAVSPAARGAYVQQNYVGAPVAAVDFGLRARRIGPHTVRLTWDPMQTKRARTTYAIFKARDDGCVYPVPEQCRFTMPLIGIAHRDRFSDPQAVGNWQYRIGLVSGTTVQVDSPALLLVSKPLKSPAR
jgi:hypothetical protein